MKVLHLFISNRPTVPARPLPGLLKEIQANAFFGVSVSTAGDVNKDGYADVIIGAKLF